MSHASDVYANLPCTPDPEAILPTIEMFQGRTEDPQITLTTIGDEFLQHDRIALAGLSIQERRAQVAARVEVAKHVVTWWEQAKANGWNPAERDEWASVAGMVDYTQALLLNAQESLSDAEDLDQA